MMNARNDIEHVIDAEQLGEARTVFYQLDAGFCFRQYRHRE